jgi:hypothetical protein
MILEGEKKGLTEEFILGCSKQSIKKVLSG